MVVNSTQILLLHFYIEAILCFKQFGALFLSESASARTYNNKELCMFSKNTKKLLIFTAAALSLSSGLLTQAFAQQTAPALIQVNQLILKPDSIERFRAIHRDSFMPGMRANGLAWRVTSTTVLGPSFQMTVAIPIDNFAALDAQNALAGDSLEQQMIRENWNSAVVSRRSFVVAARPDMSMPAAPNEDYSVNIRFQVKAGKIPQFVALWTDKILPALVASGGQGMSVFQTVQGGTNGEFFALTPLANMAALDGPGPFSGVSPEEAAEIGALTSELLVEFETIISRTDHELSYGLPGLQP